MRKYRTITIMIICILIWNIVFPCFSHATNSTIETINIQYEQELLEEGEAKKQELEAKYPELTPEQINNSVASYLLQKKEEIVDKIAATITDDDLKKQFLENSDTLGRTYINSRYGNVTDIDYYFNLFGIVVDGLSGIFTYLLKLKWFFLPSSILELIGTGLASIGTENIEDPSENIYFLTLESIFFNKVTLTDINIFNFEKAGPSNITQNNIVYKIRENIANWYYALRNLAIVFGLLALVYIGVKMAISAVAEDRAKYKKMLIDWVVSMILIFALQYIMIFAININNSIIDIFDESRKRTRAELQEKQTQSQDIGTIIGDVLTNIVVPEKTLQTELSEQALSISFVKGWGAGILYLALTAMTFLFLIVYIKRMAVIAFLAIISPLITITYSIDKSGNGRAEALSIWLREFLANVLIQPFHCIIYLIFMQNVMYTLYDITGIFSIGKAFVAIMMLPIIYKAENVIKTIFGLDSKNLAGAAAMGIMVINTAKKAANIAKKGAGMVAKANAAGSVGKASGSVAQTASQQAPQASNVADSNMNQGNATQDGKAKKAVKTIGKGFTKVNNSQVANKLAANAMGMALGYGLTGDYDTARAGKSVQQGVRDAGKAVVGGARYASNISRKNEDMLDSYQRLKEAGHTDEEIYHLTEDLLEKDGEDITQGITDDLVKDYAQSIQSVRDTQIAISDKEADEAKEGANDYVLEKIQNHILK